MLASSSAGIPSPPVLAHTRAAGPFSIADASSAMVTMDTAVVILLGLGSRGPTGGGAAGVLGDKIDGSEKGLIDIRRNDDFGLGPPTAHSELAS